MYKPSAAEINTLPSWAQAMYSEHPNVFEVERLYTAYYDKHKFEKSYHTQYYKRWRRDLDNRIDQNGFIIPMDLNQYLKNENEYTSKLKNNTAKSAKSNPIWSPVGPYQVYDNSNNPANDQTNVYSIDQCSSSLNVMFCGTEPGEVYKSTDTAHTWACVSLGEDFGGGITAIEVDPTNPNIVFAGSGPVVKRSTDGGLTWSTVLSSSNLNANEILINSANTQIVLVACDAGLYRSVDGGTSFTQLYPDKSFDVKANPANPNTVYLVKDNPSLIICEFFESNDAGATWNLQNTGWYSSTDAARNDGGARIGVTPADTNRVYAYLIGEAKANDYGFIGVYCSYDGAVSWTLPNAPDGGPYTATHLNLAYGNPGWTYHQGFYNCAIMVSATDPNKILIGGLNIYRSIDGAQNFNPVAGYVSGGNLNMHVDMQDFRAIGNNYCVTTDGGVFTSPDFFDLSTQHKNAGIRGSEYWGFGSGWNKDILVGGLYHNGNIAYDEDYGAGNFLSLGGGEASTGYVNPGNNQKTYFSDIGGKYLPSSITGTVNSFSMGMSPNETYYSAESSEMEFLPSCYNIVFLGNENKLWKSADGGASYNLVKAFGTNVNNQVKYIEISRSNSQVMYLNQQPQSGSVGTIWKTINGGSTWTSFTIPSGNSRKILLALDYTNENILWICYPDGANGSKVFKTTNGGSTWSNITTSMLNGENAHSIVCIPNTDGGIYFCSARTVFYRNNSMNDWQIVNANLPTYFNTDIARPFYRDGKLRIASYGKGIWESALYDQPTAPVAQITVDKLQQIVVCETDSFRFDDYSALNHLNATWQWSFPSGTPTTSTLRNPTVYFPSPGTYQATLTVTDGNGQSSSDTVNVSITAYVPPTSIQEGFQNSFPPAEIVIANPDNGAQWSLNTAVGGFGNSTQSSIFDNFDSDSHGTWDDMRVSVDYTSPTNSNLTFDVAHACYGGQYTDTLEVLASTDCGITFTQLYKKWGTSLATAANNSNYYTPADSEWRTETISLAAYVGTPHLVIAFRNIGLWGNNIYVDNINLLSNVKVPELKQSNFEIYPNPVATNGNITITNQNNEQLKLTLYDSRGSMIFKNEVKSTSKINLSEYKLSSGIYHLSILGETKIVNYKLVIK